MRDEDSNRASQNEDRHTEDPDFDLITSQASTVEEGTRSEDQTNEVGSETNEQFRFLSDRTIPTVRQTTLPTESRSIYEPNRLSSKPEYQTTAVGCFRNAVTADSYEPLTTVKPTTVIPGPETENSHDRELPPIVGQIGVGSFDIQSTQQISNPSRLRETLPEEEDSLGTLTQSAVTTERRATTTIMTPDTFSGSNRPELEPDELDPGYDWIGGTPYTTTTPQCILHVSPTRSTSLPFLQRVLRDTYSELEGGRPRTETLRARAGALNRMTVHGSIVTLDLTTEEWAVDVGSEDISVTHEGTDMIPELRDHIDSLYGGKLGYLVINIAAEDLQSRFRSNVKETLVETLLDTAEADVDITEDEYLLSHLDAPIRLATPRYADRQSFRRVVGQYFSFDKTIEGRIADIEALHEARVRKNDWRQVALTARQDEGDGESDEHYLWKASIAEGIAWQMKSQYSGRNEEISFDRFVEEHLLPSGPVQSEYESLEVDAIADLYISTDKSWAWAGTREFLTETPLEPSQQTDVVVEFETGRGEGAFNFRKLRETCNKYDDESNLKICIVVPPRVLFRSESRAQMIRQLVEPSNNPSSVDVTLCVPDLGQYGCSRLVAAETRLNEWFGDDE